jgi:serine phosphatase RsbU (regulator of sigma subunit)
MSIMKKILNIGVSPAKGESLNRRIRISNLISFITVLIMLGYYPLAIYYKMPAILLINSLFIFFSFFCSYLHTKGRHNLSFYIGCIYGILYFICGTAFYGLSANLHFFIIIVCLIAIALFESTIALRIFIGVSAAAFFALLLFLRNYDSLVYYTPEMKNAEYAISVANLFFLFFVTILFFIFFRRDNLLYQKAIVEQKTIIEEKQKEILDSINYAKRIQFSLLTGEAVFKSHLPEHFILFNPKDVVSGDFYWATPVSDGFVYITADCTGHGVPGAFMSLLNISKLSQVINEQNISRPDLVLNHVRTEIIHALNAENGEESKDGMDAILCKIDLKNMKLEYAAANNSFYIIRNNSVIHCKCDKMPVGIGHDDSLSFTYNQLALEKGDMIYTLTDGFADQFGGSKGKKFKYKQLEDLLLSIHHQPLKAQQQLLQKVFTDWKGILEQVDDVLIIGIRV